jgi:hypothetical protein
LTGFGHPHFMKRIPQKTNVKGIKSLNRVNNPDLKNEQTKHRTIKALKRPNQSIF